MLGLCLLFSLSIMFKIYIGGLPYQTTEAQLTEIFSSYGPVQSSKIIYDRETGRSKGFGFVEMANDEEARKAIAELQGAELGGRTITVNEARPSEPRTGGGDRRGGGSYNRNGYDRNR